MRYPFLLLFFVQALHILPYSVLPGGVIVSKKSITAASLLICITLLLIFPNLCINAARQGLLLWFNKVLPSLLPFMILIHMLTGLDTIKAISKHADKITYQVWQLPGCTLFAFMMGLLAGYPMGGRVIKDLVLTGNLTPKQGEKALCFCNNCGSLFIVGTVGTTLLGDVKLGYFLLVIHLLSAIISSLLLSPTFPSTNTKVVSIPTVSSSKTLPALFNAAVVNSMDTITYIGGYIIFFSVIAHLITDTQIMKWIFHLPIINQFSTSTIQAVFTSFLELSNGVSNLSQISSPYILALLATALAFGGLCIYFQTLYVLDGLSLSTKPYLLSKCLQATISFLLTCVLYPFFSMYTLGTKLVLNHTWNIILMTFITVFLLLSRLTTHHSLWFFNQKSEF